MQADWSLADVWERNKSILEGIVRTILLDHSLVDDVLQDAFAQVMVAAPQLTDEQEAYNYARKAVIHTAINQYRRCRRNWAMVQALQKQQSEADGRTPLLLMMEGEHERVESAIARELAAAMTRLSPERRQAIELVLGRPDKFKDICRETGIPYTTLRSRFMAAVDQLRKHMRVRRLLSTDEEVPK